MAVFQTIRSARDRGPIDAGSLALVSQGIRNRVERRGGTWHLSVEEERVAESLEILALFERENAPPPRGPEPPPEYGPTQLGYGLAAALVLFFGITGPREPSVSWFAHGSADSAAVLAGELWRTVTSLTLHADLPHVVGNALSCALFVTVVCRIYGPGAGGLLVLLAGIGGNLANALHHGSLHSSVGASTALFGAIGILGGTQFARRRSRPTRAAAWVPLAGALGLLAMLGTGERADFSAHLFGLVAGVLLGGAAGFGLSRPPRPMIQLGLGGVAVAILGWAWATALG